MCFALVRKPDVVAVGCFEPLLLPSLSLGCFLAFLQNFTKTVNIIKSYRMAWVEKDHSVHLVSTPCCVQGRQSAAQAAQSHIQPGLDCLQGWGIHSLLGQRMLPSTWEHRKAQNSVCKSKTIHWTLSSGRLSISRIPHIKFLPHPHVQMMNTWMLNRTEM